MVDESRGLDPEQNTAKRGGVPVSRPQTDPMH